MINSMRIQELLQSCPRPPGYALPSGIEISVCEAFTNRTGLALDSDLRQWLHLTNGPCIGPGGFYGIHTSQPGLDMEAILGLHPSWIFRKWIPIAGDGCGNHFVVAMSREYGPGSPVVFVDSCVDADAPAYIVASGIAHFLVFQLEAELGATDWPFCESYVISRDPAIMKFTGLSLPWNS